MLLNVISFLLVFFQLLHFGGDRFAANATKGNSFTVSKHSCNYHSPYSIENFDCIAEFEEADDTDGVFQSLAAFFDAPQSSGVTTFYPNSGRVDKVYRARSGLNERRIFLINCNFRV